MLLGSAPPHPHGKKWRPLEAFAPSPPPPSPNCLLHAWGVINMKFSSARSLVHIYRSLSFESFFFVLGQKKICCVALKCTNF